MSARRPAAGGQRARRRLAEQVPSGAILRSGLGDQREHGLEPPLPVRTRTRVQAPAGLGDVEYRLCHVGRQLRVGSHGSGVAADVGGLGAAAVETPDDVEVHLEAEASRQRAAGESNVEDAKAAERDARNRLDRLGKERARQ